MTERDVEASGVGRAMDLLTRARQALSAEDRLAKIWAARAIVSCVSAELDDLAKREAVNMGERDRAMVGVCASAELETDRAGRGLLTAEQVALCIKALRGRLVGMDKAAGLALASALEMSAPGHVETDQALRPLLTTEHVEMVVEALREWGGSLRRWAWRDGDDMRVRSEAMIALANELARIDTSKQHSSRVAPIAQCTGSLADQPASHLVNLSGRGL